MYIRFLGRKDRRHANHPHCRPRAARSVRRVLGRHDIRISPDARQSSRSLLQAANGRCRDRSRDRGVLWFFLHHGPLGTQGHLLAVGALCAFLALGVQGMVGAPALRKLSALGEAEGSRLRHRVTTGERIAAALLMITVTSMAAARYV